MTTETPKPFCPECQATWEQPWYDVCPDCQHRFKERGSLMLALLLNVLGPVVAMIGVVAQNYHTSLGENLMAIGGLILLPACSLASAVKIANRTSLSTGQRIGVVILLAPILIATSAGLGVAGCTIIAGQS